MASIRNFVPGSGYGNAYIDSLIWGGTAWDLGSGPVRVWLGESVDFDQAVDKHGSSEHLRERRRGFRLDAGGGGHSLLRFRAL